MRAPPSPESADPAAGVPLGRRRPCWKVRERSAELVRGPRLLGVGARLERQAQSRALDLGSALEIFWGGEFFFSFLFSLGVTVSLGRQLVASEWVISYQHVSQVLVLVSSPGDSVTKIISGTSRLAGSVRVGVSQLVGVLVLLLLEGKGFAISWLSRACDGESQHVLHPAPLRLRDLGGQRGVA